MVNYHQNSCIPLTCNLVWLTTLVNLVKRMHSQQKNRKQCKHIYGNEGSMHNIVTTVQSCILLITLFILPMKTHSQSESTLTDLEVTFKLSLNSSTYGNATLGKFANVFTKTDTGYNVNAVTKAQGIAAIMIGSNEQQTCDFTYDPETYKATPINYAGGTLKKEKYRVNYDWEKRTLQFADGESLDMPDGYILDICSMPFAIALAQGKGLDQQTMYVVDGKKKRIRSYKLLSSSNEAIETTLGSKETLKIVLQREFRPERTVTLWLSIDDQYAPIKVEEKRKSRTITMNVSSMGVN